MAAENCFLSFLCTFRFQGILTHKSPSRPLPLPSRRKGRGDKSQQLGAPGGGGPIGTSRVPLLLLRHPNAAELSVYICVYV